MVRVTKTKLQELFDGNQTWEQMAADFTTEAGVEITTKMVQEMFRANGFNLRTRKQPKAAWFVVIDDNPQSTYAFQTKEVELTEEVA